MSKIFHNTLEYAEIDGVVKDAFWTLISQHAEFQRKGYFYEQIEDELGWVNVNLFKWPRDWPSAEARWLHQTMTVLESYKPANVNRVRTYVVRFNGGLPGEVVYYEGIPGDVHFVEIYGDGPHSMDSLRDLNLRVQSMYSLQLAKPPPARREELRLFLQDRIAAFPSNPRWTAIYNSLYH